MDADIAELAREGRLTEAAERATARGDLHAASELFEQACEWQRAAEAALTAGEPARAVRLAAVCGAEATAETALAALSQRAKEGEMRALAEDLRQRGQHAYAARAFERAGASREAAVAWEHAGEALRAAHLLAADSSGDGVASAVRVLDVALRRDPERPDLRVALGALLLRCGKAAAALRTVQQVPDEAGEKREALVIARDALAELGMKDARAHVEAELRERGGPPTPVPLNPADGGLGVPLPARMYGRYEIVREVSSTATARVLECVDTLRGERVALKIFSTGGEQSRGSGRDALAHFTREARVLAELAHPNIVPLRDVIEQGPALVLAWMPGGALEEHLAHDAFTPARASSVAQSVLQALGEAHRIGVVHRDVKPANILFDAAGTARLADFGVAHLSDLSVTATAGVFGSLAYMSPEQREGRPATAQSDLFSVGVVLLEMLTGARPVVDSTGPEAVRVTDSLATVHRHMDAAHDAVVRSFVARDPAARPADAFAAARSLAALAWPTDVDPTRAVAPRPVAPSVHPPAERLDLESSSTARDTWLERPVVRLPLTATSLAQAAVFSRIGHRALQPILRVDRDTATLWLGVARGARLTRRLRPAERDVLEEVLSRLHDEGFVHGSIDPDALVVSEDGPVLLFPTEAGTGGSADADRAALRRL